MAAYDNSLFKYDAGYYEFLPGKWLPGKLVPGAYVTYTQKAIDAMGSIHVDDSDFLVAIYPKTGQWRFTSRTASLTHDRTVTCKGKGKSLICLYSAIIRVNRCNALHNTQNLPGRELHSTLR